MPKNAKSFSTYVARRVATIALAGALVCVLACAKAGPGVDHPTKQGSTRGYVFGWPDFPYPEVRPRGGTSLGAPVRLARQPSAAWNALKSAGPEGMERDQAAIRALAGGFRVSFDFLESVLLDPALTAAQPYRSWGTEKVYVLEDRPGFLSLQHLMVMFALNDEGEILGPFVQKHWRQDWSYEPERVHRYDGFGQWSWHALSVSEREGAWSQTVYQVDDAPRYTLVGRWTHQPGHSIWTSGEGWRPLPRRESSVRSDYQVLTGDHRITVLPTGWIHEQDNTKRQLDRPNERSAPVRARAKEIGLSRYERVVDFDFSAGDAYQERTAEYWAKVRKGWRERILASERHMIAASCDGTATFKTLFRLAEPGDKAGAEDERRAPDSGPDSGTDLDDEAAIDTNAALARVLDCAVKAIEGGETGSSDAER